MDADSIGREELAGVLKIVPDRATAWQKELKRTHGIYTLPDLLAHQRGALRTPGAHEVKEVVSMVREAQGRSGAFDELKRRSLHTLETDLMQILASARAREAECLKRIHKVVGLKTGSKTATVDEDALWKRVAEQRAGRALPDEMRASRKLLSEFSEGLHGTGPRRLSSVRLKEVQSVLEYKETLGPGGEVDEDGEKKEKERAGKALTKITAVTRMGLTLRTLAAAGGEELTAGEGPRRKKDQGKAKIGGKEATLDVSYAETEEVIAELTPKMLAVADGDAAEAVFASYWDAARARISGAGSFKESVAAALTGARDEMRLTHAAADRATLAWKRGEKGEVRSQEVDGEKEKKGGKGKKARQRENKKRREREEEEEKVRKKKKEEEKKAPGKTGPGKTARKPNSSGSICNVFRTTGKCPYGDRCIHKHLKDGDSSDDEDVRER